MNQISGFLLKSLVINPRVLISIIIDYDNRELSEKDGIRNRVKKI